MSDTALEDLGLFDDSEDEGEEGKTVPEHEREHDEEINDVGNQETESTRDDDIMASFGAIFDAALERAEGKEPFAPVTGSLFSSPLSLSTFGCLFVRVSPCSFHCLVEKKHDGFLPLCFPQ